MAKSKIFMIGGAKCVGKTSLTQMVSLETGIARLETGRVLSEYVSLHPSINFKDYLTEAILNNEQELILDTHFAQYSPYAQKSGVFERGLETDNLTKLSYKFDIHLCLLEVNQEELLQRRLKNFKKSAIIPELISEELEYNLRASKIYSAELSKPVFRLENTEFNEAKLKLEGWIKSLQEMEKNNEL